MAIKDWTTSYPTSQDTPGVEQPDLVNNIDDTRVSQIHAVRDKLDDVANKVGDDSNLPTGCLLDRVDVLESNRKFTDLSDVPSSYATQAGKGVRVNGTENGLEFTTFVGSDEKVKISGTDTTTGYLDGKVVVANGLTKTILLPSGNEQLQLSPTYGSATNTICQGDDSRLSDARTPVAHQVSHVTGADQIPTATTGARGLLPVLGGGTSNFLRADGTWAAPPGGTDVNAIHTNVAGEIAGLTVKGTPVSADLLVIEDSADSNNKKKITIGTLPSSGGGFSGREQEYVAVTGNQTFTLGATPATNANMLSGVNIIGVFRNGQRLRYQAVPTTGLEFGYTAPTSIVCKSLAAGDIITVVYST